MREHPDLTQLKRQAKELLRAFLAGDARATAEVRAHYTGAGIAAFQLHDAQLALARGYGFESWPKLKAYVDGVTVRSLSGAIEALDVERVRRMLKARPELADMALGYADERSPIHFAVMKRSSEIVRLLMRHGASARAGIYPHRDATTAWMLARDRGFDEIVAVIEDEERDRPPEAQARPAPSIRGDEEARAAVASGDLDWLRARHRAGEFTNPVRWDGGGLLTVAVQHNQPAVLELLLEFGFDPNEPASLGQGDWAAQSQGYPLWSCAALGRREMAELLLSRGANPNVHVDSSGSAVYSAYSHKQWEMVEFLRRHGGLVTADIACIYRQRDLVRGMLRDGQASPEEVLRFGASGGDPGIVRMALERIEWPRDDPRWFGCATEPLYFWHHIPWLYAGNREFERSTYIECFRLILPRCDVNRTGSFSRTLLHEVAAMRGHITDDEVLTFAQALFDAGATVGVRDTLLNSTSLGWACRWGRRGLVDLMLRRGAGPVESDADEWARPLAWARKKGHAEIARLLLKPKDA
ncbi:MAG: hypothetical protein KGN84_07070 [Acidobacteriota bacterium]|nr:hypothetical protein [Acidobacteriota bacterium]